MRAIVLESHGGPEVLTAREVPEPVPGPEEVLIDVAATAVNRADLLQRMGRDAVDVPPIRERLRCDLIERETVGPVATARSVRRPAKLQREGSGAARGGVT